MDNNQHPGLKWIRTCQECGNRQDSRVPPADYTSYTRYAYAVCKKCKSEGLDYGKWVDATTENKKGD